MPGKFQSSRNSGEAPPPVEIWVIRSSQSPGCSQAAAESPPADNGRRTGVCQRLGPPAMVPLGQNWIFFKYAHWAVPMTVLAFLDCSGKQGLRFFHRCPVPFGLPESPSRQRRQQGIFCIDGIGELFGNHCIHWQQKPDASVSPPYSSCRLQLQVFSSSSRDFLPVSNPLQIKKSMGHPSADDQGVTFSNRLLMTLSLSDTFAPPKIATKGRAGSTGPLAHNCNFFSMR